MSTLKIKLRKNPFKIASKRIKYVGINLKKVQTCTLKTTKYFWKKFQYNFYQNPATILYKLINDPKIHMEINGIPNNENSLEKDQSRRSPLYDFKTLYKAT